MIVHQEWGEVGRRHMQLPCCTSKSGGGGPGSRTFYFLAFFGTWKQQLLAFLCGNGFLFQVMVNQYYVVYRNILQSIVPAVIVLFIGDHYWSLIHFSNLEGPLSDRYGRIPALLFSLGMNCLCYTGDRKSHNRQVKVKEKLTAWPKASYFLHVVCWYPPGCRLP